MSTIFTAETVEAAGKAVAVIACLIAFCSPAMLMFEDKRPEPKQQRAQRGNQPGE